PVIGTVVLQPLPCVLVAFATGAIVDIFDRRNGIDARAIPAILDRQSASDPRLDALREGNRRFSTQKLAHTIYDGVEFRAETGLSLDVINRLPESVVAIAQQCFQTA